MKRQKKERNWGKIFTIAVLLSFMAPIGYLVVRIISGETADGVGRGREDYVLMLLQCLLGIAAILVPIRLMRRWDIEIPRVMFLLYIGFLYCAIFLGEVRSFYYIVPHWDTILHACSGVMLGALGFSMIAIFNNTERIPLNLSPFFIAAFAFCFALAMGALWEIYEFSADALFGTNMQKFALDDGTPLVGQAALKGHHRRYARRAGDERRRLYLPEVQKGLDRKADDPHRARKAQSRKEISRGGAARRKEDPL